MRSIASLLGGNHEEIERNIVHAAGKAIKTMNEQNQNVQPASAQQYYPNPPPEEATAVEMSPMNQIPEQEPPREMKRAQTVPPNALRPFIPPFMRDNTVNPASNADPNNVVDDANSSVETTKKNTKKTNTVLAT